jgi:chemotaxis protein methyltransferase CheR
MPAAPPRPPLFGVPPAARADISFGSSPGREAKLTDEEFVLLRDFLYQQSGIFVAETRKYLVENRLVSRLRALGLRSFGDYYHYLRFDGNRAAELNKLFENMTTNETSFFRNGPQLDVFRDQVLLKVLDELRAKGQKKLRIWSAGCSSGEEPYTLAIIIHEALRQEIPAWDIRITANDLSLAMLAAARQGLYNDYAVRTTPPDMLAKYFTREGSLYRIDPKLKKLVSFGQINLSDNFQLQKVERSQIVFCRNVIIYFDDDMKRSVINAFYDNLLPGGYLLIGHSESLHNLSRAFKPEHHAGSIVYRKQS